MLSVETIAPSDDAQTVFLGVSSFAAAGVVIVRNWDEEFPSEGVLEAVRIATDGGQGLKSCDLWGVDPRPSAT